MARDLVYVCIPWFPRRLARFPSRPRFYVTNCQYLPGQNGSHALRWRAEVMPRGSRVTMVVSIIGPVSQVIYPTGSRPVYRLADGVGGVSRPSHHHSPVADDGVRRSSSVRGVCGILPGGTLAEGFPFVRPLGQTGGVPPAPEKAPRSARTLAALMTIPYFTKPDAMSLARDVIGMPSGPRTQRP